MRPEKPAPMHIIRILRGVKIGCSVMRLASSTDPIATCQWLGFQVSLAGELEDQYSSKEILSDDLL